MISGKVSNLLSIWSHSQISSFSKKICRHLYFQSSSKHNLSGLAITSCETICIKMIIGCESVLSGLQPGAYRLRPPPLQPFYLAKIRLENGLSWSVAGASSWNLKWVEPSLLGFRDWRVSLMINGGKSWSIETAAWFKRFSLGDGVGSYLAWISGHQ